MSCFPLSPYLPFSITFSLSSHSEGGNLPRCEYTYKEAHEARNWHLPTTVNTEACHSFSVNSGVNLLLRSLEMTAVSWQIPSDAFWFSHASIPDPQKLWNNKCCSKPLSSGVICYIVINNQQKGFSSNMENFGPLFLKILLTPTSTLHYITWYCFSGHWDSLFIFFFFFRPLSVFKFSNLFFCSV